MWVAVVIGCSEPRPPVPDKPVPAKLPAEPPARPTAEIAVPAALPEPTAPAESTAPSPPPAPSPATQPDAGKSVDLPVAGFDPAVVAVPREGTAPHGVVIAAHANWDRPSWECDWWKRLLTRSFILCPRGVLRKDSPSPDDPRFTYKDDKALEAEIAAGLTALEAAFGDRVSVEPPMLWVGLSRGAFLGAQIATRQPARYPTMILVEGGHDPWTHSGAKAFAEGGGKRVLFVCGQGACTHLAKRAAARLEHFGVETRLENVPGMGHGLNGDADEPVQRALPWLRSPL